MIKIISFLIIILIIYYYSYIFNEFFNSFNKNLNSNNNSSNKLNENFNSENNKTKIKINNYYTTWCGWSTKFLPEWKKFCNMVSNKDNIETVEIICDDNNNNCDDVPGFPYITIENNGITTIYNGERTANKLHENIKQYV